MIDTPVPWIPEGDWHKYEAYIFGSLQRRFSGANAKVIPNVHILGIKSGRQRQIDVLVEVNVGGFDTPARGNVPASGGYGPSAPIHRNAESRA